MPVPWEGYPKSLLVLWLSASSWSLWKFTEVPVIEGSVTWKELMCVVCSWLLISYFPSVSLTLEVCLTFPSPSESSTVFTTLNIGSGYLATLLPVCAYGPHCALFFFCNHLDISSLPFHSMAIRLCPGSIISCLDCRANLLTGGLWPLASDLSLSLHPSTQGLSQNQPDSIIYKLPTPCLKTLPWEANLLIITDICLVLQSLGIASTCIICEICIIFHNLWVRKMVRSLKLRPSESKFNYSHFSLCPKPETDPGKLGRQCKANG